ncbi:MAG: hypothetical protein ACNA7K_01925 [Acholeplasmataceae bacterium]
MNKRVYNKTFGKIVRTLGFLLILVSSLFLLSQVLIFTGYETLPVVAPLITYGQLIADNFQMLAFFNAGYAVIGLSLGIILLIWAIRQGILFRVILTVLLLLVVIITVLNGSALLVPLNIVFDQVIANGVQSISGVLTPLFNISPYIAPGIFIASALLFWAVLAYKKPKRFSLFLLRVGATTLFLAMLMMAVPTVLGLTLLSNELYLTGAIGLYVVTFVTFSVGSAFGVAGFLRK